MSKFINNILVVIENGELQVFELDDKTEWLVGRPSGDNEPDIKLYSPTVSRIHGQFINIGGEWYYVDCKGKNGTVYNGKFLKPGIGGRKRPEILENGDVFIFGGSEEPVINYKTVFAAYLKNQNTKWYVVDTKGYKSFTFSDGESKMQFEKLDKGQVILMKNGAAIYMGDVTYMTEEMEV